MSSSAPTKAPSAMEAFSRQASFEVKSAIERRDAPTAWLWALACEGILSPRDISNPKVRTALHDPFLCLALKLGHVTVEKALNATPAEMMAWYARVSSYLIQLEPTKGGYQAFHLQALYERGKIDAHTLTLMDNADVQFVAMHAKAIADSDHTVQDLITRPEEARLALLNISPAVLHARLLAQNRTSLELVRDGFAPHDAVLQAKRQTL